MGNIKHKDSVTLLSELFDLFLDEDTAEKEHDLFKEWSIDVDSVVAKNLLLFKQLKTKTKAELYQLRYNRIFNFLENLKSGLQDNSVNVSALTDEIFSKPVYSELQPMFRNLKNLTEQDKKSILLDAKLLELLDELESKLG